LPVSLLVHKILQNDRRVRMMERLSRNLNKLVNHAPGFYGTGILNQKSLIYTHNPLTENRVGKTWTPNSCAQKMRNGKNGVPM
jgi:hypothetical protein